MDGITCIRKIRQLESEGMLAGHVVTVAVTANARPDHVTAALEAGMDSLTTKPYRMDDLVAQIDKTFAKARRGSGGSRVKRSKEVSGSGSGNAESHLANASEA